MADITYQISDRWPISHIRYQIDGRYHTDGGSHRWCISDRCPISDRWWITLLQENADITLLQEKADIDITLLQQKAYAALCWMHKSNVHHKLLVWCQPSLMFQESWKKGQRFHFPPGRRADFTEGSCFRSPDSGVAWTDSREWVWLSDWNVTYAAC